MGEHGSQWTLNLLITLFNLICYCFYCFYCFYSPPPLPLPLFLSTLMNLERQNDLFPFTLHFPVMERKLTKRTESVKRLSHIINLSILPHSPYLIMHLLAQSGHGSNPVGNGNVVHFPSFEHRYTDEGVKTKSYPLWHWTVQYFCCRTLLQVRAPFCGGS